jgi:CubicO group peptidase (beta-lactamase class C family)
VLVIGFLGSFGSLSLHQSSQIEERGVPEMRSTASQSAGALTGQTVRFITIVVLCVCAASTGARARDSNGELAAQIDQIMTAAYKPDQPGAAVIVVKDGKTIFRKGYGMADLELGVKIEPDHVFRIGSITKQFTAVAILELMERGKLSLSDEITKFFPRLSDSRAKDHDRASC